MALIKLEIVDGVTFRVAGKSYPRGKYLPEYAETNTDANGVLIQEGLALLFIRPITYVNTSNPQTQQLPFKNPKRWNEFVDENGDEFADFQTFTDFVTEMLGEPETADIPTMTSELTNDGSDGTSTYVEADELADVAFSGDYGDLNNLPSIDAVPTNGSTNAVQSNGVFDELALKASITYVDNLVIGLWDDRGNFDASVNAYPSSGGSGTAGAILKGDTWTISVAGTLPTAQSVEIGDVVRALVNTPGNTQANWAIQQNNIGYTAENSANKENVTIDNSTTKYPTVNLLKTGLDTKASKTFVENISLQDPSSDIIAQTYTLELYAQYAYTINELKIISELGTCTAAVKINGTDVTGISAVSVSATIATGTASAANTVAIGDKITMVISSPSTLDNLQASLKTTRI